MYLRTSHNVLGPRGINNPSNLMLCASLMLILIFLHDVSGVTATDQIEGQGAKQEPVGADGGGGEAIAVSPGDV